MDRKIDLHVGGNREVLVVSHRLPRSQVKEQLLGQFAHLFTERGDYGRRVLAGTLRSTTKLRACPSIRIPPSLARLEGVASIR